jgi:hypothetical protein
MDEEYPRRGKEQEDAPPPTGDARVDAAVAGLGRLTALPADEHVAVLEEVHGRLRDILGELDEHPGTAEGPP